MNYLLEVYTDIWDYQPAGAIWVILTSNPGQWGQLQIHAVKFIGNSSNSSGGGISSPLSKIKDVQFHQRIPVNMEKKSKGGVCLHRPYIWSSESICLVISLLIWGLFVRKIPDLAKIHSNYSGERNEKKQANKKTALIRWRNLSIGRPWEKDEPSVEGPPKCFWCSTNYYLIILPAIDAAAIYVTGCLKRWKRRCSGVRRW